MSCYEHREPPPPVRKLSAGRLANVAARTVHLGVTSVLVGGHVFDVSRPRLVPWLYATIATGVVLVFLEAFPRWRWWHEGRGALVLVKLGLMALIPWCWDQRAWLLAAIILLASVGSHMPARFRYYSWIEGQPDAKPH
jgi:hypothetical protein